MYTKTRITIGTSGGIIRAKKGDSFKIGDILIEEANEEIDTFDVGKLLGVVPQNIFRYLTVSDGEAVEKGQVIAKKKNLLHSISIQAPLSAIFIVMDKAKGTVGLKRGASGKRVVAQYPGIVVDKNEAGLVVEVKGVAIAVKDGKGHQIVGKLTLFPENVTMLTMPTDVAGKIIAVKNGDSDLLAKADALGAKGMIVEKIELPDFTLPYVIIPDFSSISRYNEKQLLLHGSNKLLLVLESTKT